MSGVDVMAGMASAIRYETKAGASPVWIAELREARAAVAELVEAAGPFAAMYEDGVPTAGETARLRAALAKFGGGQ